jgi:hypothetical protein
MNRRILKHTRGRVNNFTPEKEKEKRYLKGVLRNYVGRGGGAQAFMMNVKLPPC